MECRIFNISTGKEEDTTPLFVLARAYRAAWHSIYGAEPVGWHRITTLGMVLDFSPRHPEASMPGFERSRSDCPPDDVPPGA